MCNMQAARYVFAIGGSTSSAYTTSSLFGRLRDSAHVPGAWFIEVPCLMGFHRCPYPLTSHMQGFESVEARKGGPAGVGYREATWRGGVTRRGGATRMPKAPESCRVCAGLRSRPTSFLLEARRVQIAPAHPRCWKEARGGVMLGSHRRSILGECRVCQQYVFRCMYAWVAIYQALSQVAPGAPSQSVSIRAFAFNAELRCSEVRADEESPTTEAGTLPCACAAVVPSQFRGVSPCGQAPRALKARGGGAGRRACRHGCVGPLAGPRRGSPPHRHRPPGPPGRGR